MMAVLPLAACRTPAASPRRHLLILVDGLRPDYVTPEVMPTLTALGKRGVVFTRHHAVYPTVTRVNAASISTGAYPNTHGLMGNSVFFPKVNASRFLDTADRDSLLKVAATEGRLLTASTLGESLQAAGRKMLVVSSGSGGSALLNNHTVAGGAILHHQFTMPEAFATEMKALGPAPAEGGPAGTLDRYAVDAFLKVGLPRVDPSVTVIWLSDLDSTAHDHGIGSPETIAILKQVDSQIKRIEDGLKAAGRFDDYDIWVTSDHGFSTHTGGIDLTALLKPYAGSMPDGSPRIVTGGGAIYVRDNDRAAITGIVTALQRTAGVGAIFTRGADADSPDGWVPGTLSFQAIRWDHDRSAQILFSPDWSDAANVYGVKGSVTTSGTAGHGSTSPWDVHNTLIAAGPDLKRGVRSDLSSGNVDFAPTFLRLLGLTIPVSMQGRPLEEALVETATAPERGMHGSDHRAQSADGAYEITATFSVVKTGGKEFRYFDETKVTRR